MLGRGLGALVCVIVTTVAHAAPRTEPVTRDGFMLRFFSGVGLASSQANTEASRLELQGASGDWALALGVSLVPNLTLHAEGWLSSQFGSVDFARSSSDFQVLFAGFGAGLTWRLPTMTYVSATLGFSAGEIDLIDGGTPIAPGISLAVGQEWWVSPRWSLGLALRCVYADFGQSARSAGLHDYLSFSLGFSATFQ